MSNTPEGEPKKRLEMLIKPNGEVRTIHSDEVMPILEKLGNVTMKRASHVEPAGGIRPEAAAWLRNFYNSAGGEAIAALNRLQTHKRIRWQEGVITHIDGREQWYADLLPVEGPVLGPFDHKQEALDEEAKWLAANGFPLAGEQDCGCRNAGPTVHVVAYEGNKGGGGFDWFNTPDAADREYEDVCAKSAPGTRVFRFDFVHGGDVMKITDEIDANLPALEEGAVLHYTVPTPVSS